MDHPANERQALLALYDETLTREQQREITAAILASSARVHQRVDEGVKQAGIALVAFVLVVLLVMGMVHLYGLCQAGVVCAAMVGLPLGTNNAARVAGAKPVPLPLPWWEERIREARNEGSAEGERIGYVAGTRYGMPLGFVWGLFVGIVTGALLVKLGMVGL